MRTESRPASQIDTSVAHPARRYNYWLGGKDHFEADRESARKIMETYPYVVTSAMANRLFLGRAVRFLVGECGVRQILDVGTGLPAPGNTHEVAQQIAPEARVVYVDNDPLVMAHARALLTSSEWGETAYVQEDLRNPEAILVEARKVLDFDRPVAVMLVAVLHFIDDVNQPGEIVRALMDPLPPGSYLAVSHATYDPVDPETVARLEAMTSKDEPFRSRSEAEVAALLDGLDMVEPGLVPVAQWRPDAYCEPMAFEEAAVYAAVVRKS